MISLRFLCAVAIGVAIFFSGNVSQAARLIEDRDTLNHVLARYVENGAVPLIYARVEDLEGRVLYEYGSVNETLLPDVQVDGDTWFRVWSMSKSVTNSVLLDLVEQGVVSLDDPVSKYIPEFADLRVATANADGDSVLEVLDRSGACPLNTVSPKTTMTLRHLINHQAGFYYNHTGVSCLDEAYKQADLAGAYDSDEFIARLTRLPLIQHPGSDYYYGLNTTVLGLVAERATGKSLAALVEALFGIADMGYQLPESESLLPRFSGADGALRKAYPGELDLLGAEVPRYDAENNLFLGGEGMVATADGYADFLRMLLQKGMLNGKRILDEATVDEMVAPHTQRDHAWGHNGYNVWISNGKLADGSYGQGGLWIVGGYEGTHGWVDPHNGIVGVVMSQLGAARPAAGDRHDRFREALYDQLLEERHGSEYDLYFLSGQSNMDGFGYNAELPKAYLKQQADVRIFRGLSAGDGNEKGGAGLWQPLGPGFGLGFFTDGYQAWLSDRFGAELSFGARMTEHQPGRKVAIVKYSRGGTPLHIDGKGYGTWHPEVDGINQYDHALRAIRAATTSADIDGDGFPDRLIPKGIVWMQGEADAFDSAAAAARYEDNLRRMMDLFRAAMHRDDLPVVIGQITDSGKADDGTVMDWSFEVRAAQVRYTESDPCAVLVTETNELNYPEEDAWHYDSDGYLQMGIAFADAFSRIDSACGRQAED